MKANILAAVALALIVALGFSPAYSEGMQDDVDRVVTIIKRFQNAPEHPIPKEVIRHARGVAVLTTMKAGFFLSGRGGWGVVVARTQDGWSGPSAIGTGGAGLGLQAGVKVSDIVFILNTDEAVMAFSRGGNVVLGSDMSVAVGPTGPGIDVGLTPAAAVYAYSRSEGLFAGMSLEGTVIATRNSANARYYGRPVSPADILSGVVKPPLGSEQLVDALTAY